MINTIPFIRMNAMTDRIAYIMNTHLRKALEKNLNIKFNELNISGSACIARNKKGRHPSSILETPVPVLHMAYDMNVRTSDNIFSASAFSTSLNYVDPTLISERVLYKDTAEDTVDIRYTFDNVEMGIDMALVLETKQKQIAARRTFDILYETARVYELTAIIEIPLDESIIKFWVDRYNITSTDIDTIRGELQQYSNYHLQLTRNGSTGKEDITITYPAKLMISFEDTESSDGDEHGLVSTSYIVARIAKIKFNAPSLIFIMQEPRTSMKFSIVSDDILEVGNKLRIDKTLMTYGDKNQVAHAIVEFKSNIVSIKSLLAKYDSFLNWYMKTHTDFKDVLYILVRDYNDDLASSSYVSCSSVDISYKKDLLLRDRTYSKETVKTYDIKIYLDLNEFDKFTSLTHKSVYNPDDGRIDNLTSNDGLISPDLLEQL